MDEITVLLKKNGYNGEQIDAILAGFDVDCLVENWR